LKNDIYIQAIQKNDRAEIKKMYLEMLPSIEALVTRNSGNAEDARDVLQDGLIIIFEKIARPDFELTSSFKTYLVAVCRFVWLKKLRKKGAEPITTQVEMELKEDAQVERTLVEEERLKLFRQYFNQLGDECKKVLNLFFNGKSMREIAEATGYTENFAKTKKYQCKKKLFAQVQKDKKYKELIYSN